jgi:hypothetical protein
MIRLRNLGLKSTMEILFKELLGIYYIEFNGKFSRDNDRKASDGPEGQEEDKAQ